MTRTSLLSPPAETHQEPQLFQAAGFFVDSHRPKGQNACQMYEPSRPNVGLRIKPIASRRSLPRGRTSSPRTTCRPRLRFWARSWFDNKLLTRRVADVSLRPSDFYCSAHQECHDVAGAHDPGRAVSPMGVTPARAFREGRESWTEDPAARADLEQLLDSAAFGPEVSDYAHMIPTWDAPVRGLDIAAS